MHKNQFLKFIFTFTIKRLNLEEAIRLVIIRLTYLCQSLTLEMVPTHNPDLRE